MPPVRLEDYIQSRASKTGLAGMHDGVVKIRIAGACGGECSQSRVDRFHCAASRRRETLCAHRFRGRQPQESMEIDGVRADEIAATLEPRD